MNEGIHLDLDTWIVPGQQCNMDCNKMITYLINNIKPASTLRLAAFAGVLIISGFSQTTNLQSSTHDSQNHNGSTAGKKQIDDPPQSPLPYGPWLSPLTYGPWLSEGVQVVQT